MVQGKFTHTKSTSEDAKKSQKDFNKKCFASCNRNCVGARLGQMQTKVGMVIMLQKNRYELDERLKNEEIKFDKRSLLLSPLGGLSLHVFER